MSIGERIAILRKEYLKLSQAEFASALGLTHAAVGAYEKGLRNVTEPSILSICREYGVREEWLRNGTGDVFTAAAPSLISDLAREFDLDAFDQAVISEYLKLDKHTRAALKKKVKEFLIAVSEAEDPIEKEVEAYRQELLAEKREQTSSASGGSGEESKKEA